MKIDSVTLTKKVRCTSCRAQLLDGTTVRVVRNAKGKIREYRCHKCESKPVTP